MVQVIFLFSLCMSLEGCGVDSAVPDCNSGERIINLKLVTSRFSTRSEGGGGSVGSGNDSENVIDRNDLWIAAFSKSGELMSVLYDGEDSSGVTSSDDYIFSLSGIELDGNVGFNLMVLANWRRYGIDRDKLGSIRDVADLWNLEFSFPPENPGGEVEWGVLPMYGELEISDEAVSASNGYKIDVGEIEMKRGMAKIEISNNMEDGRVIESALLSSYPSGGHVVPSESLVKDVVDLDVRKDVSVITGDLQFSKDDNGNYFYLYLPEIDLRDGEYRINLKFTDGSEKLFPISKYENGEPVESEDPMWKRLTRNYAYIFNMISPEPEIELLPTVLICWHTTDRGRYYLYRINLSIDGENMLNTQNLDPKRAEGYSQKLELPSGDVYDISFDMYGIPYDFTTDDYLSEYRSLQYILSDKTYPDYDNLYLRNVSEDAKMIYNDIYIDEFSNKEMVTYVWLNNIGLYNILRDSGASEPWRFRNDYPTRICWHGSDEDYEVTVGGKEKTPIEYDEKRGWNYVEFRFADSECITSNTSITYSITYRNGIKTLASGIFNNWDLIPEKIDGEIYYVFYAN